MADSQSSSEEVRLPPLGTIEAIGRELRETLPIAPTECVSVHGRNGDVLWLSEKMLGPDEQNAVLEAVTIFETEGNRSYVSVDLGDRRSAACFAASAPSGELVALVMLIGDSRAIANLTPIKLITPKVRILLQRLAMTIAPPKRRANDHLLEPVKPIAVVSAIKLSDDEIEPPLTKKTGRHRKLDIGSRSGNHSGRFKRPSLQVVTESPRKSASSGDSALLELAGAEAPKASPPCAEPPSLAASPATVPRPLASATTGSNPNIREISLSVQQLIKLRSGGRTRRYEVLVRAKQSGAKDGMSEALVKALAKRESAVLIDRMVVTELTSWLKANPKIWNSDPANFSVNLSIGSMLEPNFLQFVSQTLQHSGVAPEAIGFEVPEQMLLQHRDESMQFFTSCEKIGCFVIIDDFTMHSDAVPFLASRALRVIKIDPKLTTEAMRNRLSQAIVIAISQASKVLGLHCVAKRIDAPATRQWLSAVGIDFAQGFLMEDPTPIDALLTSATASQKALRPAAAAVPAPSPSLPPSRH